MENYENKTVVVTGGGSGIGREIAMQVGKRGAYVYVTDIHTEWGRETEKLMADAGIKGTYIEHDVTKEESWDAMIGQVLKERGTVDYLFNNAGVMLRARPLSKLTMKDWEWLEAVNVRGVLFGLRKFTDIMNKQEQGGVICTTCSTASVAPFSCWAPYTVTKAASLRLCETYQSEANYFKNTKVRYAAVMPGVVDTQISNCECYRPEEFRNPGEPLAPLAPTTPTDSIEGKALGKITPKLAVERILKQLDYGYFYIYTHRDLTVGLMTEQFDAMMLNKPIVDQLVYDFGYYQKKLLRVMTPEQQKAFLAAIEEKKKTSATQPHEE
ncbi:MAG: SDR family NAD(P)-dependent oxidoreductase [Eggerthellaceae bacterium]|jgi:NAD(P)-dependent dehydrogenase (short-subunit alcohol dehydrogenase family)